MYRNEIMKKREEKERRNSREMTESTEMDLKVEEGREDCPCSVCPEEFTSASQLQAHYARTHLACQMKEKFSHLAKGSQCKLCKEVLAEESEVFVHLAVRHDKINFILRENNLPTVDRDRVKGSEEAEREEERDPHSPPNKSHDETDLEALEKKIREVQGQMSSSVKANLEVYALADMKDLEEGKISEDVKDVEVVEKSEKKRKRKGRGRPRKESEIKSRSVDETVAPVTEKEMTVGRRDSRQSCRRCGGWSKGRGGDIGASGESNLVFSCTHCKHSWHQLCVSPALLTSPDPSWKCPLCCHLALVSSLDQLSAELDSLMETVEQKRLAELQV